MFALGCHALVCVQIKLVQKYKTTNKLKALCKVAGPLGLCFEVYRHFLVCLNVKPAGWEWLGLLLLLAAASVSAGAVLRLGAAPVRGVKASLAVCVLMLFHFLPHCIIIGFSWFLFSITLLFGCYLAFFFCFVMSCLLYWFAPLPY
jgi:hypothetical protein